jgi:phage-related protein
MPNSAGVEVARISVKVSPDTREFRRQLKQELAEIERTLKGDVEVNAHLDSAQAKADFRRMMSQLKTEASKGVHVPVDVAPNDKTGKARGGKGGLLGALLGGLGLGSIATESEKASGSVQHLGKSFLGMSRMAWMATGIVAAAAPVIGLISGLIAGLPSLIGAAGVGIGAIALGMDGIKAAAAPLAESFASLKTAVSSTFEQALIPQFMQLKTLMPTLTTGMQGVASGMSSMFQGVTDALTTGAGPAQIQNFLANTKTLFEQMQPVADKFTQSFLTLSSAGSSAFGYLTGSLDKFSTQFNDMVNRVTSSGVFDGAMQGLSQTLDGVTSMFTRLMESGLGAMSQLGGPLNKFLGGFTDLAVSLMPALTSLSGVLGNVLGELGTQLAPIVTSLTPAFTELANTIGPLLTGAMRALGPVLTQVGTLLSTTLVTALQAIQPLLPGLIDSFMQLSNTLVTSLGPYIPQIAEAFGQLLGAVLQLAPMILSQLVPALIQMIPALTQMVPHVVSLMQSLTNLLPVIMPIASALLSVAGAALQVGTVIAGTLIGGLSILVGAITGVISKVSEWVSSFSSGADQIAAKAAELPGMVKSALSNLMKIGLEAGKALVKGLLDGIQSAIGGVYDFVSGIAGKIASLKGPISYDKTVLVPNGEALMEGLGVGLEKGFQPVIDQAKGMAQQISDAFASGQDPTALLSGMNKEDVKRLDAALKYEEKRLDSQAKALNYQAKMAGDGGLSDQLKAQAEAVKKKKEELSMQREMLGLTKEYTDELGSASSPSGEDPLSKAAGDLLAEPVNFAKATGKQFLSDIGISGNGFIPKLLTEGTKYIFQIGSVDEAMSIKDREERKSAMTIGGARP